MHQLHFIVQANSEREFDAFQMEFRVESLQVHVWHFSHLYVYPGYSLSFRRRALFAANNEMSEVVFPTQASFSVSRA